MAKNTYGTGSFVLLNVGADLPGADRRHADDRRMDARATARPTMPSRDRSSSPGRPSSGCATGSQIIDDAAEAGPLAATVADSGGVYVVPAFTGLGSPWWDPYARGHDHRHHARNRPGRTSPERSSSRWRSRPATSSMRWSAASGTPIIDLRVDGGASAMDLLCQIQADQLGVTGAAPGRSGDHRARRRLPRRARRGRVARHSTAIGAQWELEAEFTARARPHDQPTSSTPSGCAPSSAPATGRPLTPDRRAGRQRARVTHSGEERVGEAADEARLAPARARGSGARPGPRRA